MTSLVVMVVVTLSLRSPLVTTLPSASDGIERWGVGAGGPLTAVLKSTSQPHCSVILLTHSTSTASSLLKEMVELGAPWTVVVLQAAAGDQHANSTHSQMAQVVQVARKVRLISWCVTIVVVSPDPNFLTTFAQESRRGRLLVWTTRLLLVTRLSMPELHQLLESHWTFSMMNTMAINQQNNSEYTRWEVFVYLPYSPLAAITVRLAHWHPNIGLKNTSNTLLFPNKFHSFHGASLPIATVNSWPLFDIVDEVNMEGVPVKRYVGREYIMLLAVAQALNFTVNIDPSFDVTETIHKVASGQALMSAVRMMTLPQILSAVDYTMYVDRATFTFGMAKPPTKPQWQSLFYPLTGQVWLAICVLLLLLPPVMLLIRRVVGGYGDVGRKGNMQFDTVTLEAVGIFLGQDFLQRFPRLPSARVLVIALAVCAFILGTSYRGNLTAYLTIRKYPPRPETLDQVAQAALPSKFLKNVTWFHDYFTTSTLHSFKTVGDLSSLVSTIEDGMKYIFENKGVFFYERYNLKLMIAEHYTELNGWTPLYVAKENVLPNYSCWLIPHDAPYKADLDRVLARIIESGHKDKWLEDVMQDAQRDIRTRKRRNQAAQKVNQFGGDYSEFSKAQQPLTMTHMQGPFWLLVLGLGAAVCTFLIELLSGPPIRELNVV